MAGGAPTGNNNSGKGKIVKSVIKQRLEERAALREMVDKLIDDALTGDKMAIGMIFDRVDGKPSQAIVGDKDEDAIQVDTKHTVEFILPDGTSKG